MADVSITPANVLFGDKAYIRHGISGEAIEAGDAVYLDQADNKIKLGDNNATGKKRCDGIALNGSATGQPIAYQSSGDIAIGGTLVPGKSYYLSATPGGIMPEDDLAAGMNSIVIGVAKSASILSLNIKDTGVTISGE